MPEILFNNPMSETNFKLLAHVIGETFINKLLHNGIEAQDKIEIIQYVHNDNIIELSFLAEEDKGTKFIVKLIINLAVRISTFEFTVHSHEFIMQTTKFTIMKELTEEQREHIVTVLDNTELTISNTLEIDSTRTDTYYKFLTEDLFIHKPHDYSNEATHLAIVRYLSINQKKFAAYRYKDDLVYIVEQQHINKLYDAKSIEDLNDIIKFLDELAICIPSKSLFHLQYITGNVLKFPAVYEITNTGLLC